MDIQLHDGFKKLNLKPAINFSPEDYDEFTNFGSRVQNSGWANERKAREKGRNEGRDCLKEKKRFVSQGPASESSK